MGQEDAEKVFAAAIRRVALVMAGTWVFWVLATWIGSRMNLSPYAQSLFDLLALAGFGLALWMTFQLWRLRQNEKD